MKEAFKIWQMDQKLLKAQQAGAARPFDEHVLSGYSNLDSNTEFYPIEDLSTYCEMRIVTLPSGASATYLESQKSSPKKILVSLHGGPESFEGTEIRYLGLYRELLRQNWSVLILNYRGSAQLKVDRKNTWKNWRKSILADFAELLNDIEHSVNKYEIHLCGASFGGALALLIAKEFPIKSCVLFSPLLDLKNQKARGGRPLLNWFNRRFSENDLADFSYQNLTEHNFDCKTLVLCSQKDEVLGTKFNSKLSTYSKSGPKNLRVILQNTTHTPKSFSSSATRFKTALNWLLKER